MTDAFGLQLPYVDDATALDQTLLLPWEAVGAPDGLRFGDGVNPGGRILIGAGTAYMPAPSGEAAVDASRLAAIVAGGKRYIELQGGTYLCPATGLSIGGDCHLIGDPFSTVVQAIGAAVSVDAAMLKCVESSNIEISGVTFDYAGYSEPSSNYSPVSFRNVAWLRLRDVSVIGWPRFGLSINGGSALDVQNVRLVRAAMPLASSGSPISAGQQAQALVISQSANPVVGGSFRNLYAKGAGIDVSASYLRFDTIEVDGFTFGFAFTTEQDARCHHIQLVRANLHGGRGIDINSTIAGGVELWAPYSLIQACEFWDLDGDGVGVGGTNSRVLDNRFHHLGVNFLANAITLRYETMGAYSAAGGMIANNVVEPSAGLMSPFYEQQLSSSMRMTLGLNDFGNVTLAQKSPGTRWMAGGLPVAASGASFSLASGATAMPVAPTIPGVRRANDVVAGVTFSGTLPDGVLLYGDIVDNTVRIFTRDDGRIAGAKAIPAGSYTARVVTVN